MRFTCNFCIGFVTAAEKAGGAPPVEARTICSLVVKGNQRRVRCYTQGNTKRAACFSFKPTCLTRKYSSCGCFPAVLKTPSTLSEFACLARKTVHTSFCFLRHNEKENHLKIVKKIERLFSLRNTTFQMRGDSWLLRSSAHRTHIVTFSESSCTWSFVRVLTCGWPILKRCHSNRCIRTFYEFPASFFYRFQVFHPPPAPREAEPSLHVHETSECVLTCHCSAS